VSTSSLIAGAGLTGGGALNSSTSVTFDVGAGTGILVAADSISFDTSLLSSYLTGSGTLNTVAVWNGGFTQRSGLIVDDGASLSATVPSVAGLGGAISLNAGESTAAAGGQFDITAGEGTVGGLIGLTAGSGIGGGGVGGDVKLTAGYGAAGSGYVRIGNPVNGSSGSLGMLNLTTDRNFFFPDVEGDIWVDTSGVNPGLSGIVSDPILVWSPANPGGGFKMFHQQGSSVLASMVLTGAGILDFTVAGAGPKFFRFNSTGSSKVIDVVGNANVSRINNMAVVDTGAPSGLQSLDIRIDKVLTVTGSTTLTGGTTGGTNTGDDTAAVSGSVLPIIFAHMGA